MEHNKDIGKAIREKLESLDRTPHNDLWQSIEADLPKKRKRRILPFWLMFVSIAVIALLLYVVTDGFGNAEFWNPKIDRLQENSIVIDSNGDVKNTGHGEDPASENGAAGVDGITPTDHDKTHGQRQTGEAHQPAGTAIPNGNGTGTGETGNGQGWGKSNSLKGDTSVDANISAREKAAKKANSKWNESPHAPGKSTGYRKGNRKNGRNGKNNPPTESGAFTGNDARITDSRPAKQTDEANRNQGSDDPVLNGTAAGSKPDGQATQDQIAEAAPAKNDSIAKALAEKEKKKKEKDKDTTKTEEIEAANYRTFSLFLYAAPTYYNNFSNKSSIDKRLDSLPGRAEITFNYGGYLSFKYDDKWSVRVGAARTDLKRTTTDIPVNSLYDQNYYNLEYAPGISNEVVAAQFNESQVFRFNLIQEISYLEFPIELKYKLLDRKISIEGIGGVSTLFQRSNTVTAESDNGGSIIMGSTRSLYKAYFSANLGVGFSYDITDNFKFNAEPIFKYHLRTASVALQPYSIAVLGGFEYTFNWNTNKKKKAKK